MKILFYGNEKIFFCRDDWKTFNNMGIKKSSVDLVLTSPPYATALPYIDTDRLSLLTICGLNSKARKPYENNITGSREISKNDKKNLESIIRERRSGRMVLELPSALVVGN